MPFFLLAFIWFLVNNNDQTIEFVDKSLDVSRSDSSRPSHPNLFFDEKTFNEGVTRTEKANKLSRYHISGGIIPHHLFPGFILTDFFNRLITQNPKTIILIGPNHYEKGNFKVLTSLYAWDTPYGKVEPEESIINKLIKSDAAKADEVVLPNDHAVAGIMPFIRYYLPETKVVPLLISGHTTQKEVDILARNLKSVMSKDIVLVAPVDFSHYLTNEQAKKRDKITLEILKKFDYRQLFTLNNDYVDSPPAIATFLMVMQMLGTTKMDLLFNTNSGELQKDDYIETTSYFSLIKISAS